MVHPKFNKFLESKYAHHLNQCTMHQLKISPNMLNLSKHRHHSQEKFSLVLCLTGAGAAAAVVAAAATAVVAAFATVLWAVVATVVAVAAAVVGAENEWRARHIPFQHIIVTLTFFALSINFCGCPIKVSRSAKKSQL